MKLRCIDMDGSPPFFEKKGVYIVVEMVGGETIIKRVRWYESMQGNLILDS